MGLATCQVQRLPFTPFLVRLGLVKNTRQNHSEKRPAVVEQPRGHGENLPGREEAHFLRACLEVPCGVYTALNRVPFCFNRCHSLGFPQRVL